MKLKQYKKPVRGKLLIAVPELSEDFFDRSVILLADYNKDGAIGLILNKPIQANLVELLDEMPDNDLPIYVGGPVNTDSLFILHTLGELIPDSREVYKGLYWGGDINAIKEAIANGVAREDNMHFFLGYSGWNPGQLYNEVKAGTWVIVDSHVKDVFATNPPEMWGNYLRKLDDEFAIWANKPANPNLN